MNLYMFACSYMYMYRCVCVYIIHSMYICVLYVYVRISSAGHCTCLCTQKFTTAHEMKTTIFMNSVPISFVLASWSGKVSIQS